MREDIKAFVGLDVHKDSIAIAYADADFDRPPRFLGTTPYSVISLTKALAKLGKRAELSVCHEAGPCGYEPAMLISPGLSGGSALGSLIRRLRMQ